MGTKSTPLLSKAKSAWKKLPVKLVPLLEMLVWPETPLSSSLKDSCPANTRPTTNNSLLERTATRSSAAPSLKFWRKLNEEVSEVSVQFLFLAPNFIPEKWEKSWRPLGLHRGFPLPKNPTYQFNTNAIFYNFLLSVSSYPINYTIMKKSSWLQKSNLEF